MSREHGCLGDLLEGRDMENSVNGQTKKGSKVFLVIIMMKVAVYYENLQIFSVRPSICHGESE